MPACIRACSPAHHPCPQRPKPCAPARGPPAAQASGTDRQLAPIQRVWVYMPFMHSEELADQDVS